MSKSLLLILYHKKKRTQRRPRYHRSISLFLVRIFAQSYLRNEKSRRIKTGLKEEYFTLLRVATIQSFPNLNYLKLECNGRPDHPNTNLPQFLEKNK